MKTIEELRSVLPRRDPSMDHNDWHRRANIIHDAIDELAELRALTRCRYTVAPYSLGGRCSLRDGHSGECK